jgi:hypothetical protein
MPVTLEDRVLFDRGEGGGRVKVGVLLFPFHDPSDATMIGHDPMRARRMMEESLDAIATVAAPEPSPHDNHEASESDLVSVARPSTARRTAF